MLSKIRDMNSCKIHQHSLPVIVLELDKGWPRKYQRNFLTSPTTCLTNQETEFYDLCFGHSNMNQMHHKRVQSYKTKSIQNVISENRLPERHLVDWNNCNVFPSQICLRRFSWACRAAKNLLSKLGFWEKLAGFSQENSTTRSSLNFLRSGPRKFPTY